MKSANKWFNRLLMSYLPIFLILMIALSVIYYLAAAEISQKQVVRANQIFSEQVVQSIDYSLRTIENVINNELISKINWDPFFNPEQNDNRYIIEYEISKKLSQMKQSYPMIDSIYLIRKHDRQVLSDQSMFNVNSFEDRHFVTDLLEGDSGIRYFWMDPRVKTTFDQKPHRVVSLVRQYPLLSGEMGFMVVNVKLESIQQLLIELSGSELSFVHLYDRSGNFMTGNDAKALDAEFKGKPLSTVRSKYTEWEIQSGIYGSGIGRYYALISYIWIVLIVLTFVIGIGLIFLATSKNYKPIHKMAKRIYDYSTMNRKTKPAITDELKFIENAFDNLIRQSNEDLLYKRKHFFLELIQGDRPVSIEVWQQEMNSLGLHDQFHHAAAGLIEIDHYANRFESYGHRDQGLLRFALANVIREIGSEFEMVIWVEWVSKQRLGMIMHYKKPVDEIDNTLLEIGKALVDWVTQNLRFTVTVSFGLSVENPEELPLSYQLASDALNYKAVLGNSRVITQRDVTLRNAGVVYDQLTIIRSMAKMYRLNDDRWKEQLEKVFSDLRNGLFSREDIINLANYMVYLLYREVMELSEEIQEVWNSKAMPELNAEIELMDTLDQFHRRITDILTHYDEQICNLRQDRSHHALIQEARKFVEENYADPNMSLTYVADHFQLHSSYLSRLFKSETGENFVDYLARVRIENAMRFLKETMLPIQEISVSVGYTHYISFNRVFKKMTGTTPGDYRRHTARSMN
ncbi:AraC family transcriptional regulator [Paenibacillus alkalitolerans]|uniref:AraC family transcriptional regulator n=1 Tax=Paenibacillus alkalitolerans TaxID=2799335 RepID=UPI0018F70AF2|nr:AraC family transcriptional regulator [Paenibacillus alkalitolerans]